MSQCMDSNQPRLNRAELGLFLFTSEQLMSAVVTMPPGPSQTCLVKFDYDSKAYLCVYVLLQSDESPFLSPGLIHLPG